MELEKPDWIYFYDEEGKKHSKGKVVFGWRSNDYYEPPHEEPVLDLYEIEPILRYVRESFSPSNWKIENGEVVEVKWNL